MQTSKRTLISFLALSVGYIVLGLLLYISPEAYQTIICYLMGGIVVVIGIVFIAFYFAKNEAASHKASELPIGATMLMVGIYFIARPDLAWTWMPVVLGFAVVYDSIVKMQEAFLLKQRGLTFWWAVLIAAIATAVLGVVLILGSFGDQILLYYFGTVLLADGVINLATLAIGFLGLKRRGKKSDDAFPPDAFPQ